MPTELKFKENTAFPHLFQENPAFCYFFICFLDSSFVSKNNEIKISITNTKALLFGLKENVTYYLYVMHAWLIHI